MASSAQPSTALTKRPAPGSLMAPPPAPKRIRRPAIVLDEDTYTSAVAHIIRRDFFPGLAETDAQREYLNALESKDNVWIREAGKKLTDVMTPGPAARKAAQRHPGRGKPTTARAGATPSVWGGDTPLTTAGTDVDEDVEERPEVDLTLSLSAFQAKYISEDQESFSQIIDRQNAKRFAQNEWLRSGNRYASKQRIAQQKAIEASQTKASSQALTVRPSEDLDNRPAAPTSHKHVPFNSLMFNPEGVEDWAPTRAQIADSASLAPPKAVLHHNTRLPISDTSDPPRPPSPTMSAIRDAIDGRPRLAASEVGYDGSETPRVNGYAFVDAVGPEPEEEAPTDLLERFGAKVEGGGSTFTIHDAGRRERLHHKMVERIGSKKSGNGLGTSGNDTPKFLSAPTPKLGMTPGRKNVGNLTPAAQRLFEKVGGGTPKVRSGGFGQSSGGSKLGKEWTPTPKVKRRSERF